MKDYGNNLTCGIFKKIYLGWEIETIIGNYSNISTVKLNQEHIYALFYL